MSLYSCDFPVAEFLSIMLDSLLNRVSSPMTPDLGILGPAEAGAFAMIGGRSHVNFVDGRSCGMNFPALALHTMLLLRRSSVSPVLEDDDEASALS